MGAKRTMYQIVGCYQRGREVIGYHLQSSDGKSGPYTREQVFYLTGRGQITNCSAQVYFDKTKNWTEGKVLLRGVGTSLDSLPVKKLDCIPGAAVHGQRLAPTPIQSQAQVPVQRQAQPNESRHEIVNKLAKPWVEGLNHTVKAIPSFVKGQYEMHLSIIEDQWKPGGLDTNLKYVEQKTGDDIFEATVAITYRKSKLVLVLTQINKDGSFVARAELRGGWCTERIRPERKNGNNILLCQPTHLKNQTDIDFLIGRALDITGFICEMENEWIYSAVTDGPYRTSQAWGLYGDTPSSDFYTEFSDIFLRGGK